MVQLKICRGKKRQLVVSCQVVTNQCCGLAVIFCGFISHLIGRETINIPEIFSGVHGFTGKTVKVLMLPVHFNNRFDNRDRESTYQKIKKCHKRLSQA